MKCTIIRAILVIVGTVFILEIDSAQAQSIFLEPNGQGSIHLEALRPGIPLINLSNTSFAYFLSGQIQMGEGLQIRAEVPFMYYKLDDKQQYYEPQTEAQTDFGNPYLGLNVGNPDNGLQGEFGIRVPVIDNNSEVTEIGILTDPVERMEAFVPDLLPIYLGGNYRYRSSNGFGMRLRMVPVFWLWVNDRSDADPEVFVQYSAQAWYEDKKVGVGGGFSGRVILTEDELDIGERTFHQFGFFANYTFGSVMPGFQVRFPLDGNLKDERWPGSIGPSYSLSIGLKL
jgi:hypothetical protein